MGYNESGIIEGDLAMKKQNAVYATLLVVIVVALVCCLVACSNDEEDKFSPWDNLGGGQTGVDVTDYSSEDTSAYLIDSIVSACDDITASYDATASDCYHIDLDALPTANLGSISAYSYKSNELVIKSGGVFVLTGTFSGKITVNDSSSDVRLVLNGVNISTTEAQDSASIVFKKPSSDIISKRIITVSAGTINTLSDSVGDTAEGDGAVIQAKKRDLIINGSGTLNLNCVGAETSGIKVKTSLTINGTTINVNDATKSGIKADQSIVIKNASIAVDADGDGIKTDIEPETAEEATACASDIANGYIYIENSDITIVSGDDGISANGCLYIANSGTKTINITTNGGAPTTVTERSSDLADGKALKTGGIKFNDVDYPSTASSNYGLIISGGEYILNSNDDAIHSKGNLIVLGGNLTIATGDDGLHAEYLTKIVSGNITITKSYEGIEGATVEILDGTINVTASDDGINAANSDLGRYSFYILISGGDLVVNAQGDGLDSNGTLKITGGSVCVYGPTGNGDASLDADTGIIITGGSVIAVGSAGMVENPSTNSTQRYISLTLSSQMQAGTAITVTDENGNTLASVTPPKSYQSVIISLPSFTEGATYTITVGSSTYSATLDQIGTALGTNMHGGGNQGFRPGGPRR